MTNDLRAVLIAAFPPAPITRETIHTADAGWAHYEERDVLALLEGKSWSELAVEILERHEALSSTRVPRCFARSCRHTYSG